MKRIILPLCAALLCASCGNKLTTADDMLPPEALPDDTSVSSAADTSEDSIPDTLSDTEAPESSSDTAEDTSTEPAVISEGLWWSTEEGDIRTDAYYEVHSDGTGRAAFQETGETQPFTVTGDGHTFTLNISADGTPADSVYSAERISDDMIVMTAADGSRFTWTFCSEKALAEFSFYSSEELVRLAQDYYNALHIADKEPVFCTAADAFIDADGTVVIDLYDNEELHNILDEYRADRFTAKASDKNGGTLDLTDPPKIVIVEEPADPEE